MTARRFAGATTLATLLAAAPALSGPVLVYREGPEFCPRDRSVDAPALTSAQAIERARGLLPKAFCGPTFFVDGCDFEPEFALGIWRIYVHQYKLAGSGKDRGGLDHTYLILDPVGNCVANIPGT